MILPVIDYSYDDFENPEELLELVSSLGIMISSSYIGIDNPERISDLINHEFPDNLSWAKHKQSVLKSIICNYTSCRGSNRFFQHDYVQPNNAFTKETDVKFRSKNYATQPEYSSMWEWQIWWYNNYSKSIRTESLWKFDNDRDLNRAKKFDDELENKVGKLLRRLFIVDGTIEYMDRNLTMENPHKHEHSPVYSILEQLVNTLSLIDLQNIPVKKRNFKLITGIIPNRRENIDQRLNSFIDAFQKNATNLSSRNQLILSVEIFLVQNTRTTHDRYFGNKDFFFSTGSGLNVVRGRGNRMNIFETTISPIEYVDFERGRMGYGETLLREYKLHM